MPADVLQQWMKALGYDLAPQAVHRPSAEFIRHHYAAELLDLLNPEGEIRAQAVFDVEGIPTISFFVDEGDLLSDEGKLAQLRQRIWNQNLLSLILVVTPDRVTPIPVTKNETFGSSLELVQARDDGPLSCADVQSGDLWLRHKSWFRLEDRVDRKLLANLRLTVRKLSADTGRCRPECGWKCVAQPPRH